MATEHRRQNGPAADGVLRRGDWGSVRPRDLILHELMVAAWSQMVWYLLLVTGDQVDHTTPATFLIMKH